MDEHGSIINFDTNEVVVPGVRFFIVETPPGKFTFGEWSGHFIALGELFDNDENLAILLDDGRKGRIIITGRDDGISSHTFVGTGALA